MKFDKILQFFGGGYTMASETSENTAEKTEQCILCGKDTGVPFSTPVSLRKNYLRGCGQLCEDCCAELNRSTASGFEMTETEMEYLLEITKNAKERDFSESNENS